MPDFAAPGVYVKEMPSAIKPIAGVSTSTAGFIGVIPDELTIPPMVPKSVTIDKATVDGVLTQYSLNDYPVCTTPGSYQVQVDGKPFPGATLVSADGQSSVVFPPAKGSKVTGTYQYTDTDQSTKTATDEVIADSADGKTSTFNLKQSQPTGTATFSVDGVQVAATVQAAKSANGKATVTITPPAQGATIVVQYQQTKIFNPQPAAGSTGFKGAQLCTNFSEYTAAFGGFSCHAQHRQLTHAVYGFFNNGGTTVYVARIKDEADIAKALAAFELVDEIAIVAAPGLMTANTRDAIVSHCAKMEDRFAVLDGPSAQDVGSLADLTKTSPDGGKMPGKTDFAAWYFPWVKVMDPVAKLCAGPPDGIIGIPPSGHVAGIYARVDNDRGVHKAPANETVRGALDVTQRLSREQQGILNPKGVNCIRVLNDSILVWGARTVGGDDNADLKYINVRRTLLFLRKSIKEGTQWVVFEPNNQALWQKITRNVSAFLTDVWRSGALFGSTPQEAFYVKCDKETNPQSSIDNGFVVTEIGVAIVRPAEFVIFQISQVAGA